jgi:hypothetical protein
VALAFAFRLTDADDPAVDKGTRRNPFEFGILAVMMAEDKSRKLCEFVVVRLGVNWEVPVFVEDTMRDTSIIFYIPNELLSRSHVFFPAFQKEEAWSV